MALRVDVLDHLHQHGGVEACVTIVLIRQGALKQLDPGGPVLAQPIQVQPASRVL